jgi:hypothetical protein
MFSTLFGSKKRFMLPNAGQPAAYEDVRRKMRSGDVVLFGGHSPMSMTIKRFTYSWVSHVGMVYRPGNEGPVLLLESTTGEGMGEGLKPEAAMSGVRVKSLREKIKGYAGHVAIRHLEGERSFTDGQVEDFRRVFEGRPYEQNYGDLAFAAFDIGFRGGEEDLSSLFCSELVAEFYQRVGLIPEALPSDDFVPADFAENIQRGPLRSDDAAWDMLNQPLGEDQGAQLGPEIFLKVQGAR